MGVNWAAAAAWTFFYLVQVRSAERGLSLFRDLGLSAAPDVAKINISHDEYTKMMTLYLDTRQQHHFAIPDLLTFYPVKRDWWPRLKFPMRPQRVEVEGAQLHVLAPATGNQTSLRVQVTQILSARRRRVIEEKLIHLSPTLPKWCEFEVTSAVQSWLNGERNLGLELVCPECRNNYLKPLQAAVSALVHPEHRRSKRASPYQSLRRTDCRKLRKGARRVCCRHDMEVTFSKLRFIEMGSIVQPKSYDAGFCQGQCPPNFNYATNHSRIQSLLHQMEWKTGKRNRRAVPKACCAPSKLEPLEILRVNPSDTTKLIVEKWDNMQVVECACS
ncbi:bone morphogenetic protein 7 [Tribolium castaneum]|uniref:Maverick n=1 Tax=Tribolium castaneum TaxID=7070 RepID=D7EL56_TRICA|nr:PREDICTED: bone morphogenetic protein 7 [Tribolium castaneum]EFA11885.1 maverick [Tribolium castaneum]|eukprot:XP_001811434.1 PREDICTED: bone morphogenetic protein 7 [Tribolium castaneum]